MPTTKELLGLLEQCTKGGVSMEDALTHLLPAEKGATGHVKAKKIEIDDDGNITKLRAS